MAELLKWVRAPTTPVIRITRSKYDPFKPPNLAAKLRRAASRFDDPRSSFDLPESNHFSVLYFATRPTGAYVEVLAPLRLNLDTIMNLPAEERAASLALATSVHTIDEQWCADRHVGRTYLDRSLRFVDCLSPSNLQMLRLVPEIAVVAIKQGHQDFDLGTIYSSHRPVTQAVSRYVYEATDSRGKPRFAGLRYKSRLNNEECWAVFYERMIHKPYSVELIKLDDPDLVEAATLLKLSIALPDTS